MHLTYVALREVTWCMVVSCTQNLRRDGSSFMWHQPHQSCKYTTSVDIQKCAVVRKAIVTHVESHASAVSLLESRLGIALHKNDQQSGTDADFDVNHSRRKVWNSLATSQSLSRSNSCGTG